MGRFVMQKLPSPGLLPTSQEAGGSTHANHAMTAPGSSPGFDAGTMTYNVSTDAPGPAMPAQIPVDTELGRDRLGRFSESDSKWDPPGGFPEGGRDIAGAVQT